MQRRLVAAAWPSCGTRQHHYRIIVYLRQHYHFGPQQVAMYLKRYHEITVSPPGVWRILHRLDLSRLLALQAVQGPSETVEAV